MSGLAYLMIGFALAQACALADRMLPPIMAGHSIGTTIKAAMMETPVAALSLIMIPIALVLV